MAALLKYDVLFRWAHSEAPLEEFEDISDRCGAVLQAVEGIPLCLDEVNDTHLLGRFWI